MRTPATTTQTARPWRATARTVFQALISLAAMWGLLIEAAGLDTGAPFVASTVTLMGAVTRIMALEPVERFLRAYAPWLAADPSAGTSAARTSP